MLVFLFPNSAKSGSDIPEMDRLYYAKEGTGTVGRTNKLLPGKDERETMKRSEPKHWPDLLREIIVDPAEKQRIADELNISPITLERWANKKYAPSNLNKLSRLVAAIPPVYQQQFRELIIAQYSEFASIDQEAIAKRIPSDFWPLLVRTRKETSNRFWQVCSLTLQQALVQLDAPAVGTELIIARCMPPRNGIVRSLREDVGMGNHPWIGDLQPKHLFLGAESLAGYAIAIGHEAILQDIEKDRSLLPIRHLQAEKSAAAFPVTVEGDIAGCLLVYSAQTNFFTPERHTLLNQYVDVLTLAFRDVDFFSPSLIELRVMPPQDVQEQAFSNFAERRDALLEHAKWEEQSMNTVQAEQVVLEELEEEFLQRPSSQRKSDLVVPT